MLHSLLHPLRFPDYRTLKWFEGKGNWAIKKYYQFPHRFFYRHKLRMIIDLMPKGKIYRNILDFGSGPGIFLEELTRHALFVKEFDKGEAIDPRWRYEAIVCASVLEFCNLDFNLPMLSQILYPKGDFLVASPLSNRLTKGYLKLAGDTHTRNTHQDILSKVSKYFKIVEYREWLGLYFSIKAVKK